MRLRLRPRQKKPVSGVCDKWNCPVFILTNFKRKLVGVGPVEFVSERRECGQAVVNARRCPRSVHAARGARPHFHRIAFITFSPPAPPDVRGRIGDDHRAVGKIVCELSRSVEYGQIGYVILASYLIGMVDTDGDGFRELRKGEKITLSIQLATQGIPCRSSNWSPTTGPKSG